MIKAEMIEANEFYDLAMRYNVSCLPQTTIDDCAGMVLGIVYQDGLLQAKKRFYRLNIFFTSNGTTNKAA